MLSRLRPLIFALFLAVLAAPTASAQVVAGEGENMQIVASLQLGSDKDQKNEIDLAGDYAYVSSDLGLHIINISNPVKPFQEGFWACEAGWGDVDISADAKLAVLTNAHGGECLDGKTAIVLLDIADIKNVKKLGTIENYVNAEYVHTATLDNTRLYLNTQEAAFYPQDTHGIPVWDISNPRAPKELSYLAFNKEEEGVAHDSYIDHRPDGKTLLYAASIHANDVWDVTDVLKPVELQRTPATDMTISHQAEPNHDRTLILVDDESAVDGGVVGQIVPGAPGYATCGKAGSGQASTNVGSTHFFAANPDGTYANNGAKSIGSFNKPFRASNKTCTAHVFWTAPNENRFTQAWYSEGANVVEFEDPVNPKELGFFNPEGDTMYWSAKPHRGYVFATDMTRGLDILKYTGEGGTRWPATAPPAEIQRAARHGVPYVPLGGAAAAPKPLPDVTPDARVIGRIAFTAKLKKIPGAKGKKVPLTITFTNAKGKKVGAVKFRRAAGRKATAKVFGGAVAGSYRYTVKAGKKVVGKGRFTVRRTAGMSLPAKTSFSAGVK